MFRFYQKTQAVTESKIITQSFLSGCVCTGMHQSSNGKGICKDHTWYVKPNPTQFKTFSVDTSAVTFCKKIQSSWGDNNPVMKIPVKPTESFKLVPIKLKIAVKQICVVNCKGIKERMSNSPQLFRLKLLTHSEIKQHDTVSSGTIKNVSVLSPRNLCSTNFSSCSVIPPYICTAVCPHYSLSSLDYSSRLKLLDFGISIGIKL